MARRKSFQDILAEQLGKVPTAARLVIALDPKSILDTGSIFRDSSDREWSVLEYFRNDLELRFLLDSWAKEDKRLLLFAKGIEDGRTSENRVDLSYIPDLMDEASEIIDCSPAGIISNLIKNPLPEDVYEEPLVSLWSDKIDLFLANLSKFLRISGKSAVLTKYDGMALSLATSVDSVSIESLVTISPDFSEKLRFYVKTILSNDLSESELKVLTEYLLGSTYDKDLESWLTIDPESLIKLIYLGSLVLRYAVPLGLERLQQLGFLDFDIASIKESAGIVFRAFAMDKELSRQIILKAETGLRITGQLNAMAGNFMFGSAADQLKAYEEETSPIVSCLVARRIIEKLVPSPDGKLALAKWQETMPVDVTNFLKTPYSQKARCLQEIIRLISGIEAVISKKASLPKENLLDLMNKYRSRGAHLLELNIVELKEKSRFIKDEPETFLIVSQYAEERQKAISEIIIGYNTILSRLISHDFQSYTKFDRLNTQILRNLIQVGRPRKETVWIIIFDGVRLDTWDCIIRPRILELFDVEGEEQLYLACLPSYTDVSRVSFLAGRTPAFWRDHENRYTEDHNILFSRLLVLGREESRRKVKILARSEEKAEDSKLEFGSAQYRCMIFNISDEWIHKEHGNLVRVNEIIKEKLEKAVIPELINQIAKNDVVVITSDHGFMELKDEYVHRVDLSSLPDPDPEKIYYRYIKDQKYKKGIEVSYGYKQTWTVAEGFDWFERPQPKGRRPRYSHGGVSMAEMVIPAVRVKRRVEKKVEVELTVEISAQYHPGDIIHLPIYAKNQGTEETKVSISARLSGRFVDQDSFKLPPNSSYKWLISFKADPKANQLMITAQYATPEKEKKTEKRQIMIPIKEEPGRIGIDTSALDLLDEFDEKQR